MLLTTDNPNRKTSTTTGPAAPSSTHEPWVTKTQLAAHLNRSTKWIERHHHKGLPSEQSTPGGHRRYQIPQVEAWLRSRSATVAAQGTKTTTLAMAA